MSSKLDEKVILRILREERSKQLNVLREELDVVTNISGQEKKVVTPGLKLRSKDAGMLYTVHAIGPDSVVLREPDGQTIHVCDTELEKNYELD
jgi:hypothetical protein